MAEPGELLFRAPRWEAFEEVEKGVVIPSGSPLLADGDGILTEVRFESPPHEGHRVVGPAFALTCIGQEDLLTLDSLFT